MTDSIFVPLISPPLNFLAFKEKVDEASHSLGVDPLILRLRPGFEKSDLIDGFVEVVSENGGCWVTFDPSHEVLTEGQGYKYMANITTRGNAFAAGILAYSLCLYNGSVAFDDSRCLGVADSYSVSELFEVLRSWRTPD